MYVQGQDTRMKTIAYILHIGTAGNAVKIALNIPSGCKNNDKKFYLCSYVRVSFTLMLGNPLTFKVYNVQLGLCDILVIKIILDCVRTVGWTSLAIMQLVLVYLITTES